MEHGVNYSSNPFITYLGLGAGWEINKGEVSEPHPAKTLGEVGRGLPQKSL